VQKVPRAGSLLGYWCWQGYIPAYRQFQIERRILDKWSLLAKAVFWDSSILGIKFNNQIVIAD
jgi:hypothetical protein